MSDFCFWEKLFLIESSYLKFLILRRRRRALKLKKRIKIKKYLKRSTSLPQNPEEFVQKFGVKSKTFNYIFRKIYRHINKKLTTPAEKRLAITLNFLASGDSFNKLGPAYNLSQDSARIVVYETLEAISDHLGPKHMGKLSQKKLKSVAKRYYKKFKFPSCIGTIDKEFVKSRCTRKSAEYHQKNLQVPIIGMADANYKFLAVDVAEPPNTQIPLKFLDALDRDLAKISHPEQPEGSQFKLPYVVLGTKYFPLRHYMIKPFPKRILTDPEKKEFNNRFEEVHKVVEDAFNFLRKKWAVLTCGLKVDPKRIETIVRCVCILHNILIHVEGLRESDLAAISVPRKMKRDEILSRSLNKSSKEALHMRETLKNYFLSQRRETENGYLEGSERPAKRRRLASSDETSSSSDDDTDEFGLLDSDSSSDETSEDESEEVSSSEVSASELDSDAEDVENGDDDVDIADEIDIKEEPLDGDTDEDIKPDIGDLEDLDTNASNEQNNPLEIKPDPDANDREAAAESEEHNSTTKEDEVKIKEEPDINSSSTT